MIRLYDTMAREKRELVPADPSRGVLDAVAKKVRTPA